MKREQWSSNLGFLLAAAGSAIGLGNLWKFPYIAGSNGGAVFLMLYLVLLILLGTPLLLAEMAVGRATRLNAIDACRAIHPRWGFVGAAGVVGAFVILSYSSVIGGWVLKYLFAYMQHSRLGDADAYYTGFVTRPLEPVLWHLLFAACCCGIVAFGVSKGIERISKIFLPVLLLTLIAIGGYALTLPGASQGLRFLFLPDFSQIHSFSDFASILVRAMGQVFFSLSIGMGTLITYGSYLDRKANLQKNAVLIPLFDLVIALLAGIAILPCVFSFGLEPSAGSGLLFRSLPYVFDHMRGGRWLAIGFFALVFLAAVTSAISLLESIAAFFIDHLHWNRIAAAGLSTLGFALIGVANSLSMGLWNSFTLFGMSLFDLMVFLSDNVLMPIGGFFLCILASRIWGFSSMLREISSNGQYAIRFPGALRWILRWLAPAMILVIFAVSLF
ncbi:MAG: sodium-dependent transporter [Ruminococcus callidus]|nr:sodium-dependent transporter [Ruminococcus callidus]